MREQAEHLFVALHRESQLYADNLGLSLTAQELKDVKERLVIAWVAEQLAPKQFTVADWLYKCCDGESE